MDIFIIILSSLFFILGILGCFLPVIPGPPLAFVAVLLLELFTEYSFNDEIYFIAGLVIFVTFLDYYVQIKGVQLFGGGKKSTNGAIIGLIAGLFIFPPFGILIGPFIGSFIGALMESDNNLWKSIKIATGAFVGFISGIILKISVCGYIIYYFVTNVI
tara:strand:- start:2322 stop:2798 length:477 start_codon:yes stop_codon:yes gene_type:complete